MDFKSKPSSHDLNRLFSKCNQDTYPHKELSLALENSIFHLTIVEERTANLTGFVRATSDKGLNANLWNLAAAPVPKQIDLLKVLVYCSLGILKRDMPGCSVSIAAPSIAINPLKEQGFLLDPTGIRAMGYRLR